MNRHVAHAQPAAAPARYLHGQPWLGIDRTVRRATAAEVAIIVPHEAGALAVRLFTPPGGPPQGYAGGEEIFGEPLARFANLAAFGVAARLIGRDTLAIFRAADSRALRHDDSVIAWEGGYAPTLRIANELREAVAAAVYATLCPPAPAAAPVDLRRADMRSIEGGRR